MPNLSTEIKTHVVKFKGSDDCAYVTDEVAKKLSVFRRAEGSVSFPLVDSATGRLIRDVGKYEIASIAEIKEEARSAPMAGMRWVCDYGVRHFMHQSSCDCRDTYRCREMGVVAHCAFLDWCRARFPAQSIAYSGSITDTMRNEFLREKSLTAQK